MRNRVTGGSSAGPGRKDWCPRPARSGPGVDAPPGGTVAGVARRLRRFRAQQQALVVGQEEGVVLFRVVRVEAADQAVARQAARKVDQAVAVAHGLGAVANEDTQAIAWIGQEKTGAGFPGCCCGDRASFPGRDCAGRASGGPAAGGPGHGRGLPADARSAPAAHVRRGGMALVPSVPRVVRRLPGCVPQSAPES